MQINELKAALKEGRLSGVYVLCGEESFLKRHYLGEIRRALLPDRSLDAFNRVVLEGEKIDFDSLRDAIQAPPMMAERKLVEWHLADFSAMREGDLSRFADLCEECRSCPEAVVCFVVDADRLDAGSLPRRPSKLYTALSRTAAVICFERSGEGPLAQWVARHLTHEGVRATPAVISLLIEQCGTSMDALSGEICKLVSFVRSHGREEITAEDVALVASRGTESDAFGLQNALLAGRKEAAYAALLDMKLRKADPMLAIGAVTRTLGDLFSVAALRAEGMGQKEIAAHLGMHEYKTKLYIEAVARRTVAELRAALAHCRHADLASKTGGGAGGYLALELLLSRVL